MGAFTEVRKACFEIPTDKYKMIQITATTKARNKCEFRLSVMGLTFCCWAFWIVLICCATTDNTSISIRLNSSKHAQAPELARPLRNFPIAMKSSWSEQLKTTV